jgi:glycosyltransferase involved in cell wall biosynthesis
MKIHAYFVCFNEERILPSILDYYSGLCSKIFIFDNGSTDSSKEIALSYEKVKFIPFDTKGMKDNKKHSQIKTEEYKKYSRKGGCYTDEVADWIICCDMDEVIYAPNLIEILKAYKEKGIAVPQITGFDMVGENNISSENILDQYDLGVRSVTFDKRAVFDVDFDMSYTKGCHSYGPGFELMKDTYGYSSSNEFPIALLHYKHVGDLLYESAVKNLDRFDVKNIKKLPDGKYIGPGAHYLFYKEKGPEFQPHLKGADKVLGSKHAVLFDDFIPTVGDLGEDRKKGAIAGMDLSNSEINTIRDSAVKLEDTNLKMACELMIVALRLRPSGPFLQKKVKEYKDQLSVVK